MNGKKTYLQKYLSFYLNVNWSNACVRRIIIFDLLKVVPTIEGATVRDGIALGGTVCGGAAVWGTNGLGVTLTGGSLAGDEI